MGSLAIITAWVAVAAVLMAVFYWVVPLLSRIVFVTRVEEIRDAAVDLVIDNELPGRHPAVDEFIRLQDVFARNSEDLTLARLVAYNMRYEAMGVRPSRRVTHDRSTLTQDQQRTLVGFEESFMDALSSHLVWGSPFGLLVWAGVRSRALLSRRASTVAKREAQPLPTPVLAGKENLAKVTYGHFREDLRAGYSDPVGLQHHGHRLPVAL